MKSTKIFLLSILISTCILSCSKSNSSTELTLVSFNQFHSAKLKFVEVSLKEKFKIDSLKIIQRELPSEAFYKPRNRYRADKLIHYLKKNFETEKVVGLTEKDISTASGKHEDWGIMGLAYRPGKSCVISTFRTFRGAKSEEHKNERLKKVIFHEFGHTLGLPHCEDSESCIMKDAEGKVITVDETDDFCEKCKSKIQKYLR